MVITIVPPRYYDKILERTNPDLLAEIKAKRKIVQLENQLTDDELARKLRKKKADLDRLVRSL